MALPTLPAFGQAYQTPVMPQGTAIPQGPDLMLDARRAPAAGPGPSALAMPSPTVPQFKASPAGGDASSLLAQIPAMIMSIKHPELMGAALAGLQQGRDRAKASRESAQQTAERRQVEAADFYGRMVQNGASFDDPIAFEQWKQAITPLAQHYGIPVDSVQFSDQKKAASDRKLASDALGQIQKTHGDDALDREDITIDLGDGRTVPISTAKQMAGWAKDAGGKWLVVKPPKPDLPNTSEEHSIADALAAAETKKGAPLTPDEKIGIRSTVHATWTGAGRADPKPPRVPLGSFEDYVQRTFGDSPTPVQIRQARKDYGQADDKASNDVTSLTPAALDMAAYMYRTTGQMPAMGMGDKVTRGSVLNRAASLTPEDMTRIAAGANIPAAKADYAADSDSLKKMKGQRDAISAFEKTASKNIDLFLAQAGKVVDTGSSLANKLARSVSGALLGSPDQAAYDAARQVAINEIAKVTQGGGLSGVLSDSARHEISAFNPETATLKQTVAVMRLLKQDMANRTKALDEGLKGIKDRMSPTAPKTGSGVAAADPLGIR